MGIDSQFRNDATGDAAARFASGSTSVTVWERVADTVDSGLKRHRNLYLLVCGVICILTFCGYSHAKLPWIDEVLQMMIARMDNISDIRDALLAGIQVDPPVVHTLQHFTYKFIGDDPLLYRLPSILGFATMCVVLTVLLWRYAPPVFAAAVFFLPYATTLRSRAMDARPYGLMFGFSALTLLCWDNINRSPNSTRWRVAFTISLAITLLTHFYSVYIFLPLALGELAKWVIRKRVDWRLILSCGIATIPYLCFVPILVTVGKRYMKGYFYRVAFPNFHDFYSYLMMTLPFAAILILIAAAIVLCGRIKRDPDVSDRLSDNSRFILAAGVGFLLLPMAGYAAGLFITGFFVPYYHMLTAFGLFIAIPIVASTISGGNRLIGLCVFACALGYGCFVTARGLTGFVRTEAPYPTVAELRKVIPEPSPDILVPSTAAFLPMFESNRHDPENNLMYLADRAKAMKILGTDTSDTLYPELAARSRVRVFDFEDYVSKHDHLYMVVLPSGQGVAQWQFTYFLKDPTTRLRWIAKVGSMDLFRVELRR
jgi:hypothetical protein